MELEIGVNYARCAGPECGEITRKSDLPEKKSEFGTMLWFCPKCGGYAFEFFEPIKELVVPEESGGGGCQPLTVSKNF